MLVVHTHLTRKTEHGEVHTICWLNVKPGVKVGSRVTLLDSPEEGFWTVMSQGMIQDDSLINRKWGLDLPKTQRTER